jgi:hypothetical protein
VTRGALGAALIREVGAGAAGTRVAPGAALSRESGTRGALCREGVLEPRRHMAPPELP